jgi:hypothetical protein
MVKSVKGSGDTVATIKQSILQENPQPANPRKSLLYENFLEDMRREEERVRKEQEEKRKLEE